MDSLGLDGLTVFPPGREKETESGGRAAAGQVEREACVCVSVCVYMGGGVGDLSQDQVALRTSVAWQAGYRGDRGRQE